MNKIQTYKSLDDLDGIDTPVKLIKIFIPYSGIKNGIPSTIQIGNNSVHEEEGIIRIVESHIMEEVDEIKLELDENGKYEMYADFENIERQPEISQEELEILELEKKLKQLRKTRDAEEE